jgi:hypothetical protein
MRRSAPDGTAAPSPDMRDITQPTVTSMQNKLRSFIGICLVMVSVALCAEQPLPAPASPAQPQGSTIDLVVPAQPVTVLDLAALSKLAQVQVTAATHDETPSLWQGVALFDVLRQADTALDKPLRGPLLASFVRVTATDGYQVVFSVAELNADFGHTQVILVDRHDGKPLTAEDGPFRLAVPGDKRAARWLRNVRTIELVDGGSGSGKIRH